MLTFTWSRRGGFECSSKGTELGRKFSALNAIMPDGRSIECWYQCDTKQWQPGGTDWRLGKGRPPKYPGVDLWAGYLKLWKIWALRNPQLMAELRYQAIEHGCRLSDCFATTEVNQARALVFILNEMEGHYDWSDSLIDGLN